MKNFRKNIFYKGLLIFLVIIAPFILVVQTSLNDENTSSYSKEIKIDKYTESINNSCISENNGQICNSSTGICGPPTGWYSNTQ